MQLSAPIDEQTFDETEWWALYTRHQHEKMVAEILAAKAYEVFLPVYQSVRRWQDRSKKITLPLFPCYVFVRGGVHRRLGIVSTPGVHMIVTRGDRIAGISDQEITAIRRALSGPGAVEPHPFIKCGDRVRVNRGPLEGIEGILTRKKNLYRLVLSVDMLAQSVAVEIDAADVSVSPQQLPVVSPNVLGTVAQSTGAYQLAR